MNKKGMFTQIGTIVIIVLLLFLIFVKVDGKETIVEKIIEFVPVGGDPLQVSGETQQESGFTLDEEEVVISQEPTKQLEEEEVNVSIGGFSLFEEQVCIGDTCCANTYPFCDGVVSSGNVCYDSGGQCEEVEDYYQFCNARCVRPTNSPFGSGFGINRPSLCTGSYIDGCCCLLKVT